MDAILKYKDGHVCSFEVEKIYFNVFKSSIIIKLKRITNDIEIFNNKFWYEKIVWFKKITVDYADLLSIDLYFGSKGIHIENGDINIREIYYEVLK